MILRPGHHLTPVILAFVAATLWGLWWIPIRHLESQGMSGAQASVSMNVGAALAAALWLLISRGGPMPSARAFAGAALVGVAVSFFSVAITLTDVVRAILLFYLAPAWGKVIEWAFMGQPWRWPASVAIVASLCGAYLVLGGGLSLDGIGSGDLLAVLGGMAWAVGAALIFTAPSAASVPTTVVTAVAAVAVALGFGLVAPGPVLPGGLAAFGGVVQGALIGVVYVLPILVLTLWSARRLPPAALSFLLTAEILSGVSSSALMLNEAFGMMQLAGAVLILTAALSEVLPGLRKPVSEALDRR